MTLFDIGTQVAPEPTTKRRTPAKSVVAKWATNSAQTKCYDCVAQLAAGEFITAKRAQWRRTEGDDHPSLYCYEHATPRRDADAAIARKLASHGV